MKNSKNEKMFSAYRRNGDTFYKVEDGVVTKIEPDTNIDYYQYVGLTGESSTEVLEYDETDEETWDTVLDDVVHCARIGSRPNIPPPPGG